MPRDGATARRNGAPLNDMKYCGDRRLYRVTRSPPALQLGFHCALHRIEASAQDRPWPLPRTYESNVASSQSCQRDVPGGLYSALTHMPLLHLASPWVAITGRIAVLY